MTIEQAIINLTNKHAKELGLPVKETLNKADLILSFAISKESLDKAQDFEEAFKWIVPNALLSLKNALKNKKVTAVRIHKIITIDKHTVLEYPDTLHIGDVFVQYAGET